MVRGPPRSTQRRVWAAAEGYKGPVPRLGWFRGGGQRWEADEDEITVRRDAQDLGQLINAEAGCLVLEDWQMAALEAWKLKKRDYNRMSRDKYRNRRRAGPTGGHGADARGRLGGRKDPGRPAAQTLGLDGQSGKPGTE